MNVDALYARFVDMYALKHQNKHLQLLLQFSLTPNIDQLQPVQNNSSANKAHKQDRAKRVT